MQEAKRSGDLVVLGCGLNALSVTEWALGDLTRSRCTRDESIAAFTAANHAWGLALGVVLQARTAIDGGEAQAERLALDGLQAARSTGDLHLVGIALEQATRLALRAGRLDEASDHAIESVAVQERIGYTEGVIASLHLLGQATLAKGDAPTAEAHHRRALSLAMTIGHAAAICEAPEGLAQVAAADGEERRAASLLNLAEHHRDLRSLPRRLDDEQWVSALRSRVRGEHAISTGRESLEDAARAVLQESPRDGSPIPSG